MDTRAASYVVVVREQAVLLAHWNEGGRSGWTLPGGGMEDFETAEETAIREFLEETGYRVELDGVLGVDTHYVAAADRLVTPAGPLRSVRVVYAGHIVGGELTHEVDGSTDECRWVPLDEVADLDTVELVDAAMTMAGLL
ncbi:NUDIX domain-containing protein [Occultella glacieicola]|uniref:NUDIX domain-containing protein n=1 Tax=Occultella glacieicola TaxID=2518684 RepID=A0ABY2E614_9MICO|nr:NUDIX domain-containing protein [Occultella glacieicola]TDE94941.1 NUDIX domain-containing protein [Occultella glacieicola]